MNDTVRIEYMTMNNESGAVFEQWTVSEYNVVNNMVHYIPRAMYLKKNKSTPHTLARVRIVSEQTNRVMDLFQ